MRGFILMKYADLINFNPIESIIQLTAANDKKEAINLVKSYVMSDDMADKLTNNMLSQLRLEDVVDNKGVLLVGNYGTGKSHLMSVISSIAYDAENLENLEKSILQYKQSVINFTLTNDYRRIKYESDTAGTVFCA